MGVGQENQQSTKNERITSNLSSLNHQKHKECTNKWNEINKREKLTSYVAPFSSMRSHVMVILAWGSNGSYPSVPQSNLKKIKT